MEGDQEPRRFFCRFCDESFSNGRVLGGHMRSHLGPNSNKKIEDGNDDSGYVLRENPKKSWKFSGSGGGAAQANLCQVCGKGFESPRALFGHLRHHSTRERKSNYCSECGKGFASLRALTGHMRWHPERVSVRNGNGAEPGPSLTCQGMIGDSLSEDNERSGPVRKKRSKRVMRYKNFSNSCSFSDFNESSSVTGAEQEVEDVAMCLMMLSRGVRNWSDYVSVCESSENNYVHQSQLVVMSNEGGDESLSFSVVKVDSCVSDSVNVVSGKRKLECWENDSGFVFKKPKVDDGSVSVKFCAEVEEEKVHSADPEMLEKKQYKCRICSKCFDTHQALGGHCNAHKMLLKSCSAVKVENCDGDTQTTVSSESKPNCKLVEYEFDETSDEHEICSSVNMASSDIKKRKVHECPVCFRVFRSGQALGGHKRAHYCKVAETGNKEEQNQDLEQSLSLKAQVDPEDQVNVDSGFKQWWGGSNYSHEALVGV